MRAPYPPSRSTFHAAAAAGLLAALGAVAPAAANPAQAGETALVECRLPPQLHTLGRNATYLAAGRQMQLTVAECKQRGGTWSGGGPGAYAGANANANAPLAVTVGGSDKGGACPLQGTVTGLKGGSLAVRAGPGTNFARLDKLNNGARVFLCDRAGDGDWVGVVYGSGDCGLAKPINPPRAYAGSCRTGWVRSTYLR